MPLEGGGSQVFWVGCYFIIQCLVCHRADLRSSGRDQVGDQSSSRCISAIAFGSCSYIYVYVTTFWLMLIISEEYSVDCKFV